MTCRLRLSSDPPAAMLTTDCGQTNSPSVLLPPCSQSSHKPVNQVNESLPGLQSKHWRIPVNLEIPRSTSWSVLFPRGFSHIAFSHMSSLINPADLFVIVSFQTDWSTLLVLVLVWYIYQRITPGQRSCDDDAFIVYFLLTNDSQWVILKYPHDIIS